MVWWLVCRIIWRWIKVLLQPCCNPSRLTGLKTPTNQLTNQPFSSWLSSSSLSRCSWFVAACVAADSDLPCPLMCTLESNPQCGTFVGTFPNPCSLQVAKCLWATGCAVLKRVNCRMSNIKTHGLHNFVMLKIRELRRCNFKARELRNKCNIKAHEQRDV